MAMPSGNAASSEKMPFPGGGASPAAAPPPQPQQQQQQQWYLDERDGFISWLRGEFAAANAIIDSLCHHLRAVGEPGEYDAAIGCIQQRRCNWNPVLHMQQYFSVAEVIYALQQAAWRRQQQQQQQHHHHHHQHQPPPPPQRFYDPPKIGGKEFRRSGAGFRQGYYGRSESFGVKESSPAGYGNGNGNAGSEKGGGSGKLEEIKPGGDGATQNPEAKGLVPAEDGKEGNSFFFFLGLVFV